MAYDWLHFLGNNIFLGWVNYKKSLVSGIVKQVDWHHEIQYWLHEMIKNAEQKQMQYATTNVYLNGK